MAPFTSEPGTADAETEQKNVGEEEAEYDRHADEQFRVVGAFDGWLCDTNKHK